MPKQVCRSRPRCSNLVTLPQVYCDTCVAGGAAKETRPSAARRGYDARWRRESKAYLLQHPIAVDYFKNHEGRLHAATVVDHVIPHRGNMTLFWDKSNWQGLTKWDHDRKTALEDGGFGVARSPEAHK